jgi:hypothetical protein
VAALHFPTQVLDNPALGPTDESSVDSPLKVRAKIGIAGIGISPSKLGIGEIKLFKAFI